VVGRSATLLALAAVSLLISSAASGCGGEVSAATEHTLGIHFSKFDLETMAVPAGVPVTITLRNDDPIAHEWIVGTKDVHERHRTGTEPYHDAIPSEVTIPAFETRVTTLIFREPGTYTYICHLPGHEAYGMTGTLLVVASEG
jgi:uncharacterized cupredoxin-like copper-binding protein